MANTYEMKDSGVEWIGDVPKGWEVFPFKKVISQNDGGLWGEDPYGDDGAFVLRSTEQTVDGKWDIISPARRDLSNVSRLDYYRLKSGDLLITKSSGSSLHIGKTSITDDAMEATGYFYSNFMQRVRICDDANPLFFWFILNSPLAREQFAYLQNSTSGLGNINSKHINNLIIPAPPLPEQAAIAAYLDEKCTAIDDIVAGAKATIEEYKKWKASVIFEAVTKGLDPNAEMKDSGVEWIGQIPKGWKICKLKRLCQTITDGSHFSPETVDEGIPYITASDVDGIGIAYQQTKKISLVDFQNLEKAGCRPLKDDVLLVKDGATTGRVGLMIDNEDCVALSSVAILRPNGNTYCNYLMYVLMSEMLQYQIRKSMAGSAMPRTTLSKLIDYFAIICPFPVQAAIASYLDEKCGAIDGIIAEKEALIAELENYKKSLIFETVTGKRRVC